MSFWGKQGAGCLPLALSTGRVLLTLRSSEVYEPNTWGIPGGAIDDNESPKIAARREMSEEVGYSGKSKIVPAHVFKSGNFQYHNFIAIVEEEFEPILNWENDDAEWFELNNLPSPLHFGVSELFNNSMNAIIDILKNNKPIQNETIIREVISLIIEEDDHWEKFFQRAREKAAKEKKTKPDIQLHSSEENPKYRFEISIDEYNNEKILLLKKNRKYGEVALVDNTPYISEEDTDSKCLEDIEFLKEKTGITNPKIYNTHSSTSYFVRNRGFGILLYVNAAKYALNKGGFIMMSACLSGYTSDDARRVWNSARFKQSVIMGPNRRVACYKG